MSEPMEEQKPMAQEEPQEEAVTAQPSEVVPEKFIPQSETPDQSVDQEKVAAEKAEEIVKADQEEIAKVRESFTPTATEKPVEAANVSTEIPVDIEETPQDAPPAPAKSWWKRLLGG